ncbi:MAG TPA: hypothetical protein VKB78_12615 [Pirellulales bacterium]|nr:hypothetical protein [Pirellulales bacterium]
MAARESQGLQIALIIFVILAIAMSVTTYLAFTNFKETEKKLQEAQKQATDANSKEQVAKTENENLKQLITGSPSDDWTKVHDSAFGKINNELAALGLGTLPDDQKNFYKVLDQFSITVKKSYGDVESRDRDLKQLKAQLDSDANKAMQKLKAAETARDQAMQKLTEEQAAYKKSIDDLTKEKDTLIQDKGEKDKKLEEQKTGYERQITEMNAQVKRAKDDVAAIKEELKKYYHLDPSASGGQITWINQRDNMAYINLGWDDGLHRRITFSVFPAGTTDVAKAASKGKIEVVNVTGPHEAEAKIVENPINNPLLPRDMIHTQGWHPGQHEHFGIVGFIDIDGAGIDETNKLVDLITANGGIVDMRIVQGKKNSEGKSTLEPQGSMSVNTRFVIEGDMSADTPAKAAFVDPSTKILNQAKGLNVETIGLPKFLAMMGYTPKSSAPGGGTVGAAAAGPDDNGGFRPRKPPARGKDDSAF